MGGGENYLGRAQDISIERMEGGPDGQVLMKGVEVSPCPSCGEWGRVPDGIYDMLRGTVATLRRLDSGRQLWLVQALQNLPRDEPPSAEQLDEVLQGVPSDVRASLSPLLQSGSAQFWLPIIIAVIGALISVGAIVVQHQDSRDASDSAHRDAQKQVEESRRQADDSSRELNAEIGRLVEAIQAEGTSTVTTSATTTSTTATSVRPRLGRNAPCWCASGTKFKYCHGK